MNTLVDIPALMHWFHRPNEEDNEDDSGLFRGQLPWRPSSCNENMLLKSCFYLGLVFKKRIAEIEILSLVQQQIRFRDCFQFLS